MNKRKTLKEWQEESDLNHNNEFKILEEPINANHVVKILHKKCGNIIESNLNNHKKRYCKYCSGKHKRNLEEWQKESDTYHKNEFIILDAPHGKTKVNIKHKKCGYIFKQTMNNHINHLNGCPKCSKKIPISKLKLEELQDKSDEIHGKGEYTLLEKPDNYYNKVKVKHNVCGSINTTTMKLHLTLKCKCSTCSESNGEQIIRNYLSEKNIEFIPQKSFKGCDYKRPLKFDFFLTELNTCIEFDGIQHFKPVDFFGGTPSYLENLKRDNIKNDFCKKNNIKLIRIAYYDDPLNILDKLILS